MKVLVTEGVSGTFLSVPIPFKTVLSRDLFWEGQLKEIS